MKRAVIHVEFIDPVIFPCPQQVIEQCIMILLFCKAGFLTGCGILGCQEGVPSGRDDNRALPAQSKPICRPTRTFHPENA